MNALSSQSSEVTDYEDEYEHEHASSFSSSNDDDDDGKLQKGIPTHFMYFIPIGMYVTLSSALALHNHFNFYINLFLSTESLFD